MYLYLCEKYLLKNDNLNIKCEPINNSAIDNIVMNPFTINETIYEFLKLCDGTLTFEKIVSLLHNKYYEVSIKEIKTDFEEIKNIFLGNGILLSQDSCIKRKLKIINEPNLIIPNTITIDLTNMCQLSCKHCFNNSAKNEEKNIKYIELKRISKLFKECKNLNITSVVLTGGEARLHPDFYDIVKLALNSFTKINIATNGQKVISDELINLLINNNVMFQISLDGNQQFHNWFRSDKDCYQNIYKNIDILVKNKIPVIIAYTLNKENKKFIEEEIVKVRSHGVSSVSISNTLKSGQAVKNNIIPLNSLDYNNLIEKLSKKYSTENFTVGDEFSIEEIEIAKSNTPYNNKCGAGYNLIHLDRELNVFGCPLIFKYSLGNMENTSLKNILSEEITRKYLNIYSPSKELCTDCKEFEKCCGCIAAMINIIDDGKCKRYEKNSLL